MGIPTISMAWMERPTLRCELRLALLMLMAYAMATSGEDGVHPLRAEEDDSAPLDLFLELSGTAAAAPMANVTAAAAAKKSQDVATASAASDAANADFANAAKLLMSHTHKIKALTKKAKEAVKGGKDEKERHAEGVDADAANSKEETEQAADNVRETKEAAKEAIGEWHKAAKEQQRAASSAIGKAQLEASAHRAKAQIRADITTDAEHAGLLLDHVVWEFNLGRSLLCHLFLLWQDWISNRSSKSTRQARHL